MRAFLFALILAVPGLAQMEGNPENWCRDGFFSRDSQEFKIGKVIGSRAYFHSDEKDECPEGTGCSRKAYVVKGT